MREFHVEEWFHIKGRGDVAAVRNDEEFERDTGHLIGEKVMLDGVVYTVKGVESHAITPIRKGAPIALLIAEPRRIEVHADLKEENSMEENREALHKAVREVEGAGGGTVHLPAGTFLDTRILEGLAGPNTTIRGANAQSTILAKRPLSEDEIRLMDGIQENRFGHRLQ